MNTKQLCSPPVRTFGLWRTISMVIVLFQASFAKNPQQHACYGSPALIVCEIGKLQFTFAVSALFSQWLWGSKPVEDFSDLFLEMPCNPGCKQRREMPNVMRPTTIVCLRPTHKQKGSKQCFERICWHLRRRFRQFQNSNATKAVYKSSIILQRISNRIDR